MTPCGVWAITTIEETDCARWPSLKWPAAGLRNRLSIQSSAPKPTPFPRRSAQAFGGGGLVVLIHLEIRRGYALIPLYIHVILVLKLPFPTWLSTLLQAQPALATRW